MEGGAHVGVYELELQRRIYTYRFLRRVAVQPRLDPIKLWVAVSLGWIAVDRGVQNSESKVKTGSYQDLRTS